MCGIVGARRVKEPAKMAIAMAQGRLQHRGQEAAGCVSTDNGRFREFKGLGLAEQVFKTVDISAQLPGEAAICHLRYATTGASQSTQNVQPFVADIPLHGKVAVAHNGNLTNYKMLRAKLEAEGRVLASTSDSEVFLPLVERVNEREMINAVGAACQQVEGAYALLFLTTRALYAACDPFGFRPLFYAPCGDGWIVASETSALEMFRTGPWQQVDPGVVIEFSDEGLAIARLGQAERLRRCGFEYGYFMMPSSRWEQPVETVRKKMGAALAAKNKIAADLVAPVPDSANSIALGFAQASGIPFDMPFLRNHYYRERTFIQADQILRERGVEMKFIPVPELIEGKRIVIVDDSIVRGNTLRKLVRAARDAGAKEVHLAIGYPPVIHPCHYGIDMQSMDELIATKMSTDEMRQYFGADSLRFLSVQEWMEILGDPSGQNHCYTCITGDHPCDGVRLVQINSTVRHD